MSDDDWGYEPSGSGAYGHLATDEALAGSDPPPDTYWQTINDHYPPVMNEDPDSLRAAGEAWFVIYEQFDLLAKDIRTAGNTLADQWKSPQAQGAYLEKVGALTSVVDDWSSKALSNSVALKGLAGDLEPLVTKMSTLWHEYQRENTRLENEDNDNSWGRDIGRDIADATFLGDGKHRQTANLEHYSNLSRTDVLDKINTAYATAKSNVSSGMVYGGPKDAVMPDAEALARALASKMPSPGGAPSGAPGRPGAPKAPPGAPKPAAPGTPPSAQPTLRPSLMPTMPNVRPTLNQTAALTRTQPAAPGVHGEFLHRDAAPVAPTLARPDGSLGSRGPAPTAPNVGANGSPNGSQGPEPAAPPVGGPTSLAGRNGPAPAAPNVGAPGTPPGSAPTAPGASRPGMPMSPNPAGRGAPRGGAPALPGRNAPGTPGQGGRGGPAPSLPGRGGQSKPGAPSCSGGGAGTPALPGRGGKGGPGGVPKGIVPNGQPIGSRPGGNAGNPGAPGTPARSVPRALQGRPSGPTKPGAPTRPATPTATGTRAATPGLSGRTTPSGKPKTFEEARKAMRRGLAGRGLAAAEKNSTPAAGRPRDRRRDGDEETFELSMVGGHELFEPDEVNPDVVKAPEQKGPVKKAGPALGAG